MPKPPIAVVMGSDSDLPKLEATFATLRELGLAFTADVISAHRTPAAAHEFAAAAEENGYRVIIAAAGGAAHLAGVLASQTALPVIGVPIPTSNLGGLDSLLSTVQMPGGVPVATVGIGSGGAKNAAVLAAQIVAVADPELRERLKAYRERQADEVAAKSDRVKKEVGE
ncbi:MAG: 5-(carboxyamino)imidazole ribonucleotide mutase [Planctomycetota bacterium]